MKKRLLQLHSFLFALLFIACNAQTEYNKFLVQADSLTESQLDSALYILQNFPMDNLKAEANSAYYALLITQIRDKYFIIHTNDSLIHSAIVYYSKTNNIKMLTRAYYYTGCVYRDLQKKKEAATQYLIAQTLAEETGNKRLLSLIYNNMEHLYYTQNLNTQADSIYQLAEQLAIELKDSTLQAETSSQRGMIWMEKGEEFYPKAEKMMLKAFAIAEKLPNKHLKGNVFSSLSILDDWMQNGKKAVEFAIRNLAVQKDSMACYNSYKLLGSAYYQIPQYDSAHCYLQKSLPTKNFATKAGAYMCLANIAREQGDLATSLIMERNYSAYMDSLQNCHQSGAVVCAEKDLQLRRQEEKYNAFSKQTRYYIISTCILFIAIGIVAAIITFFMRRKKKQHHGAEAKIRYKKGNIQFEQSDIYQKMSHIIYSHKQKEESEMMHKEDWVQLITETNKCWNNIIQELQSEYNLAEDEINLCCLCLTDLPVSYFCHILNCTRDTVYKKADRILEQRMGFSHKEVSLKEVLKKRC